ncbi:MAG: hypothetical protein AMXMBFR82_45660 [Candidatus Hydrogenedentota bacterium]
MAWYYAQGDERVGPLSDEAFQQLVHQGSITAETLVWREGMQNWAPYGSVAGQTPAGSVPQPHDFSASPMTVCSSCGRTFPSEEVIEYQGSYICAECKPIFFQQLKEGGLVGGAMEYAGFWIRVGAAIIDGIILFVPNMIISILIQLLVTSMDSDTVNPVVGLLIALLYLLSFAIPMAYETYFIGKMGQTPGKMVCGIKVVRSDGDSLTYLRAFGRHWAKYLSYLICYIGVIIVAFDDEKRGLHDHICDTRVIRI